MLAEPGVIHGVAPGQAPCARALGTSFGSRAWRCSHGASTPHQEPAAPPGRLTHPLVDFLTVRIQGITVEVSDLSVSKDFYENVLGFQPGEYYEPTKWQPYSFADQYFAIREIESKTPRDDFDITNFELDDVEGLVGPSQGLR